MSRPAPPRPLAIHAWAFTAAAVMHNLEEAWQLPAFVARHPGVYPPLPPGAFDVAAAVLALAFVSATGLAMRRGARDVAVYVFAGYVVAMLLNVFLPHLAATLWLRAYTPGLGTAVLLVLPLGAALLRRLLASRWIEARKLVRSAPFVVLAMAVLVPLLIGFGRLVAGR
jgi:hypothetical protein